MTSYLKALLERLITAPSATHADPSGMSATASAPPRTASAAELQAEGHYAEFGCPSAAIDLTTIHVSARRGVASSPTSPNDRASEARRSQGEWSREGPRAKRVLGGLQISTATAILASLAFAAAPALASPPEAPTLTVEAPTKANEATFEGVLNLGKVGAEGTYELDEYQFIYNQVAAAKGCKGGGAPPAPPALSLGAGDEAPPAQTVSGLIPATEYAVCLRVENPQGESSISPAVSFTTAEATAPVVETQSANTEAHVTVSATINPGGVETSCEVQYGKTAALEATPVPCLTTIPAGDTGQTVTVKLEGLEPKTEYHFKFVASNEKGTTPATEEATFTTGQHPPIALTNEATEVKRARATLGGVILPSESEHTTYYYEYGTAPCAA